MACSGSRQWLQGVQARAWMAVTKPATSADIWLLSNPAALRPGCAATWLCCDQLGSDLALQIRRKNVVQLYRRGGAAWTGTQPCGTAHGASAGLRLGKGGEEEHRLKNKTQQLLLSSQPNITIQFCCFSKILFDSDI
jgi:hypothetical protein